MFSAVAAATVHEDPDKAERPKVPSANLALGAAPSTNGATAPACAFDGFLDFAFRLNCVQFFLVAKESHTHLSDPLIH